MADSELICSSCNRLAALAELASSTRVVVGFDTGIVDNESCIYAMVSLLLVYDRGMRILTRFRRLVARVPGDEVLAWTRTWEDGSEGERSIQGFVLLPRARAHAEPTLTVRSVINSTNGTCSPVAAAN